MNLYVVKGDLEDFDYAILGCYTSKEELIRGATNTLKLYATDGVNLKDITEDYGFSGLVYNEFDDSTLNDFTQADYKKSIYWDNDKRKAYLK